MTLIETGAFFIVLLTAALVGYLVPVLIQLRKAIVEAERFLVKMRNDLPPLLSEVRLMTKNVNMVIEEARGGVTRATNLLDEVDDARQSVQDMQKVVRGSSSAFLSKVINVIRDFKSSSKG